MGSRGADTLQSRHWATVWGYWILRQTCLSRQLMQQLNLQLYGRTAKTEFNERLSARKSISLTPDPAIVDLSMTAPKGQAFVEVRLDPADQACSFILLDLRVRSDDGAELFRWDGKSESLGNSAGIEFRHENEQLIVDCITDDPFILLPLTQPRRSLVLELHAAAQLADADKEQLASAVRSLQASLRFALDDLASEQEGLQDALLLHQAHSRHEDRAVRDQLSQVLGQTVSLDAAVTQTAGHTREVLLGEVRHDWQSLRKQIAEVADEVMEQGRIRDTALVANLQAEFAKLIQEVGRFAASQEVMNQIRHELHVLRDGDAVDVVRKLKAEAEAARAELKAMRSSLAWRLTHPFRRLTRDGHDE
jgi:hypothetical protein